MLKNWLSNENKKQFHISLIALVLTVIAVIAMVVVKNSNDQKIITADMIHSKEYETVESEDEGFDNCEFVKFTAFFTKDLDGNGTAEKLLGSCTDLSATDTLYMDINVLAQGYLKDGTISIEGKNFDLNMAMIRDDILKYNYISKSVKNIELNQVNPGTQKLIIGNITPKLGNNINNYSKDSKVVFTGTYVDDEGHETSLRKEINLKVEWYGSIGARIDGKNYSSVYNFYTKQMTSNVVELEVSISETQGAILLKENELSLTIPSLKGYDAIEVKCVNENIVSNYDNDTKILTIRKDVVVDEEGNIENVISSQNNYKIQITYPQEALDAIENYEEIKMPASGYYVGYNLDANEFENPIKSNIATKTFSLVFEKEPIGEVFNFRVNIEDKGLVREPFYGYALSKQDLIDLYNGHNIEKFEYTVSWDAVRGTAGTVTSVMMKESKDAENVGDKYDGNLFADYVSNKALYFGSNLAFIPEDGTVRIYNDDTNELIKTFTRDECKNYTSQRNAYVFDESVKHIRVHVDGGFPSTTFKIYFIKSIDLEKLKTDFTLEQIEGMDLLATYIYGACYNEGTFLEEASNIDSVKLIALRSNLKLYGGGEFSTQENYTMQILRISAGKFQYGDASWKNGQFLVKFPEELTRVKINSITSGNSNVEVTGYDLEQKDGCYYLRILTANEAPTTFDLTINYDLNVDPRVSDCYRTIEIYGSNEHCDRYISEAIDTYDANSNLATDDYVAISGVGLSLVSPTSLVTLETISNYNEDNDITVAPNVAEFNKETDEATVNVSITNNYNNVVKDITIMGRVPKANNSYIKTKKKLGSNFNTYMTDDGIQVPDAIKNVTTIYYSTNEDCSYDYTDTDSEWKTKEQVTNFKDVRSFLIILNDYELAKGISQTFTYDITIEDALNYNDVAFSTHAVKYELATDNGTLAQETEPNKVGIRIVRKYNLKVTKYRLGTNFVAPGNTYRINELDENNSIVNTKLGTTNTNGEFVIKGIYLDRIYTFTEIKTSSDYELNDDFIMFKVTEDTNDKTKLVMTILTQNGFKTTPVLTTNEDGVDVFTTTVEDEPKYTLTINKKDENGPLQGAWFYIQDKTGVSITNANGTAKFTSLSVGEEYTLVERRAEGHYLLNDIKFKVVRNDEGNYSIESESSEIKNVVVSNTANDKQVQVSFDLNNESIPTYKLKVLKIEDTKEENKKYLEGARFLLTSADSNSKTYYTTDENGEISIEGLFAYVDGKDVSGLYKLQEVEAPVGYSNNAEIIEFKVTKDQNGYSLNIVNENSLNTVYNKSIEENIATITISDIPMFKLVKTDKDSGERLANINFVIYELDDSENVKDYAKDVNGEYLGNLIDDQYVITTDENGEISLPLRNGKYQMYELDNKGYKKNNTIYSFSVGEENNSSESDEYKDYFTLRVPESTGGTIEINCIEDLVDMAIETDAEHENYYHNNEIDSPYTNKYIKLMRTLDFNQDSSYRNPNDTETYGDYNGNGQVQTIKEELTTAKGWFPICNGTYYTSMGNTFDGQGFEIRNLYHNGNYKSSRDYGYYGVGLFGTPGTLVVKNLGVTGKIVSNGTAGGIISYPSANDDVYIFVINCYNKIDIEATGISGGIIGDAWYLDGGMYIENSYNAGNITTSSSAAGGMYGYRGSGRYEIKNCYNTGNIKGGTVGGIAGLDSTSVMINCYNEGTITGDQAGGLSGRKESNSSDAAIVANCYNSADITGTYCAYGITYDSSSKTVFEKCYNTGNITGGNAAGISDSASRVTECFNTGNILATGTACGICTNTATIINDCYNDGNVESLGSNSSAYGICRGGTTIGVNLLNTGEVNGKTRGNLVSNYYYDKLQNSYYIDKTKVSEEGTEITEDYSKSIEFYNRLNTSGRWIYNPNTHPLFKSSIASANITDGTQINVENVKERYVITTDVNDVNRPKGGTISGEDEASYEIVKYKENNEKEIVMTPWEGYELIGITINGKKINYELDENGSFTIKAGDISNIEEDKHIVVTYGLINADYTIQKVDEEDENIKLQGAEFLVEQIEDYSPEVQIGELENTSTNIDRIIRYEDNEIEGVLGEIVSTDSNQAFVKSGDKYVTNLGLSESDNRYHAEGTMTLDLSEKTGKYCVKFNVTSDGRQALFVKDNKNYGNFVDIYINGNGNYEEKTSSYYSGTLIGGNVYTLTLSSVADTDVNAITINSIKVFEIEEKLACFELVDGKYKSVITKDYAKATGIVKLDLRQRIGKYKLIFNDIYLSDRYTYNASIGIKADGYNKSLSLSINTDLNIEEIIDGGRLYTIEYSFKYTRDNPGYLSFAPLQIESLLTNQTGTTDEDGIINLNLAPGKYQITETKAPEDYELNEKVLNIELTADSEKNITITNKKHTTVNITTDVEEYEEEGQIIRGGTISGEDLASYESVRIGESNTKEVIITPDNGYTISKVTVNGQTLTIPTDGNGIGRIPANYFKDMQEDKKIVVRFTSESEVLKITKVDAKNNNIKLANAEFRIEANTEDISNRLGEISGYEEGLINYSTDSNATTTDFIMEDGKYVSTNAGINNSVSWGCIPIDLTDKEGIYTIVINAEISAHSSDYGLAVLGTSKGEPNLGMILQIFGDKPEDLYRKEVEGGQMYYITFAYARNHVDEAVADKFTINSINVYAGSQTFTPQIVTTNENGEALVQIQPGEYKVTETRAPEGYFLDSEPKIITVTGDSANELTFANDRNPKVITHYILDGTGPAYNTNPIELIDSIETSGTAGEKYITELKLDIDEYELIKDNNGEYIVPENASGKYTDSDIHVYYYYRLKPVVLTVHHYLDGTNTKVADDVVENYLKGDTYTTQVSTDALHKYNLAYTVGDTEGQINEDKEVTYFYNKKDAQVIVHYVENGTNTPLADDVTITGKVDDQYTTSSSDEVPSNYTLVRKTNNWNGTMTVDNIEVTYYYQKNTFTVTPQINKSCNLSKLTDRTTQVPYVISYNATIKDYIGSVEVEITDTLDYKIDAANSNLNGGTYNDAAKTIKWNVTIPDINTYNNENNEQVINITKTISLLYKDVDELADSIRNTAKAILRIENTTRESEDEAETEISLPGHLIVRYVDKYTDEEIADRTSVDGALGSSFNTDDYKKTIANYTLVEEPDPKTGVYTKGTITKTYYYAMNASLRVQHIDKLTNQKLVDDEVTNGKENDDYTTSSKTIEHYKVSQADLPTNATGKLTVVRNSNGTYTTETVVKYYYIHDAKVIENHIDIIDNRVLATETHNGYEGDVYNIPSRTIDGYTLVETYNNENKIPANKAGNMTRSDITVNYYYIRPAKVIVQHIDKATNEKIVDDETINGVQNQAYTTSSKNVENYVLVETPDNKNGSMTVTVDGDGTVHDTITVTYIYSHVSAGVIEKHVDIETGAILYNEVHDGNEGDAYKIDPKEYDESDGTTINFKGYELVETDRDSVNRLPDNAEGTMTIEPITVTYYYRRPAKVRVQYIDKLTGETLTDDVIINGYQNDPYTTSSKIFENYKIDEDVLPTNAEGQMLVTVDDQGNVVDETIVKYYYIHNAKVVEKHIDITNNNTIYSEEHNGYEGDSYDIDAREYYKENNLNKEFEGYDLVTELDGENKLPTNSEGSMTRETIEVIYYYIKKSAVKANYYDIYTNEKIANEEIINGHEGDQYETEDKDIDGYEIVLKDKDGNVKYPTNAIGKMTSEIIEVNYYYIKKTSVTARYYDIVSGEEIAEQNKKDGLQGDEYTTEEKEIDNYDIVKENYPDNAKGNMGAEPIFVDYYYIRKMKVIVHYVDRDTKEEVAQDIIIDGHEGDVYHTKALDVEGYELVRVPKDKDGTMSYVTVNGEKRDYKEVTYYYAFIIDKPVFPQTGENSDKFIVLALIGLGFMVMVVSKRLYDKNQKKIELYNEQMKNKNSNKDI